MREIGGVMLGIVCRWRDVITIAVAAKVEEHAAKLVKLPRYRPPDTTMAAVAMQAKQCERLRRRRINRGPNYLVRESRPRAANPTMIRYRSSQHHTTEDRWRAEPRQAREARRARRRFPETRI